MSSLVEEGMQFVNRRSLGTNAPLFYHDAEQKYPLRLLVAPINKPKSYRRVYYLGEVRLNVIGIWRHGFKEPLWIMTNLDPETGLALYDQCMKIEFCFRGLKSLLLIDKVMNKSREHLNKMLAMVMLAYAISVLTGESIRDVQYAQVDPADLNLLTVQMVEKSSRWFLFSGPFLLLKQRYRLERCTLKRIVADIFEIFSSLILANVRSLVRT